MKFRTVLLIAVSLLLVVQLPSCKFFQKGKIEEERLQQARLDSIRVADSLKLVNELKLAREKALQDSLRVVEEHQAWLRENRYNIIVGSFITPEYAKSLAEEYKAIGYNPRILEMKGSQFNLVSAEVHSQLSKAISRLHQFQDTVSLDAWLYIAE